MNKARTDRAHRNRGCLAIAAVCAALLTAASCASDANNTPSPNVIVSVSDVTPGSLSDTGSVSTVPAIANTAIDSPSTDSGAPAGDRGGSLVPNGG